MSKPVFRIVVYHWWHSEGLSEVSGLMKFPEVVEDGNISGYTEDRVKSLNYRGNIEIDTLGGVTRETLRERVGLTTYFYFNYYSKDPNSSLKRASQEYNDFVNTIQIFRQ